jgi:hypothetical protein
MDTDGNRPNVADLNRIGGVPDASQPLDTIPLWKAGMRRVLFAAAVTAVGVLVSSVVVGVAWLWHEISSAKAAYREAAQARAELRARNPELAALQESIARRAALEQTRDL